MVSQVLAASEKAKFEHVGKSGRVYKSDHVLSKQERRQIDEYDAKVEAPKRAGEKKSTLTGYFREQKEEPPRKNAKPLDENLQKEATKQLEGPRRRMQRPKVEAYTPEIGKEIAAKSQEAIGKFIKPATDVLMGASDVATGASFLKHILPGFGEATKKRDKATNEMVSGLINTPVNAGMNFLNLGHEVATGNLRDAPKSAANLALDIVPVKLPGFLRDIFKFGDNVADDVTKAIGEAGKDVSGIPRRHLKHLKQADPKAPKSPVEQPLKPQAEKGSIPKQDPEVTVSEPKTTGISHAEVEKLREEGLIDKPRQTSRKADADLIEQSKKHAGNEQSIANEVLEETSERTLTDSESLALGQRLNKLVEDMRSAKAADNEDAFFKANADAERIANALDESGSRQGRAFRARQFLFENEVDPWIVERKARKAGASEREITKLKDLATKNQKEIQEVLPDWDPSKESIQTALNRKLATDLETAKAEAGIEVLIEGVKRKAGKRTPEAIRAEREAQSKLIRDLVKKTFKESMTVGPQSGGLQSFFENTPEVFKAIRKYIELIIEERKIVKLDDLYEPAKEDIRKMLKEEMGDDLPEDFDVTDSDVRAIFAKFYESTSKTPNQAQKMVEELRKQSGLVENIERVTEGLDPVKGKAPRAASNEVKRLRNELNKLLETIGQSPGQDAAKTRLQEMVKKLEAMKASGARPNPKEVANLHVDLKKQIQSLRKDMRLEDTIDDLEEQLREGTLKGPQKRVQEFTREQEKLQYKVEKLRGEVKGRLMAAKEPSAIRTAIEILNTPRTLLSTGDVSWVFRQSLKQTVANPRRAVKSLGTALRGGVSEEQAFKIMRDMEAKDSYRLADQAGVRFEDFRPGGAKNEAFLANWVGRIPGVGSIKRFSERNFVIGLNHARLGMYEDFLKKIPNPSKEESKAWARYINDASGSGELGKFEGAAADLASALFSPRLLASRIRSPLYVFNKNPRVRNRAISDVVKLAAVGNTALAIAHANGAKVTMDPDDADWGKIRIGNQATDIWGGYQQPLRATARIAKAIAQRLEVIESEKIKTGPNKGKAKTLDPWDLAEQYMSYKMSPGFQAARTMLSGKNAVGEDVTLGKFIESIAAPLNVQGARESAELNEWLSAKTGWSIIGNSTGFGVSTYEKKKDKSK